MILKIKCADGESEMTNNWFIVDNIARINYYTTCPISLEELDNWEHISRIIPDTKDSSEGERFIYANCHIKSSHPNHDIETSEYNVVFNTVGYLCNDNGKTLEKLIA